jgi:hypothetical protein
MKKYSRCLIENEYLVFKKNYLGKFYWMTPIFSKVSINPKHLSNYAKSIYLNHLIIHILISLSENDILILTILWKRLH